AHTRTEGARAGGLGRNAARRRASMRTVSTPPRMLLRAAPPAGYPCVQFFWSQAPMFALAFARAVWSISWLSFVSFAIVAASGGWAELRFVSPSASAIFAYASEITLKSGRMSGGAFSESAFRYAEYVFTLPLALPVIAWLSWDERLTRSRQFLDVAMPAAI